MLQDMPVTLKIPAAKYAPFGFMAKSVSLILTCFAILIAPDLMAGGTGATVTATLFVEKHEINCTVTGGVTIGGTSYGLGEHQVELEIGEATSYTLTGSANSSENTYVGGLGFRISPSACGLTVRMAGGSAIGWSEGYGTSPNGGPVSGTLTVGAPDNAKENDAGGSDASQGPCKSCEAPTQPNGPPIPPETAQYLNVRFGTGRNNAGKAVGSIYYNQELGTAGVLARAAFEYRAYITGGEVIADSGGLRQVYGPEGLADIVSLPDGSIEVRYYAVANVGPKDLNGLYTITAAPFVVHRIEVHTDAIAGQGLKYTITRGAEVSVQGFYGTSNSTGSIARTVHPDGRISEFTTLVTVDPLNSTKWTREVEIKEFEIVSSSEVLVAHRHEEFASFGWGEVIVESVVDPNGDALTTTYAYYLDQVNDGASFKKLKHIVQPTGNWTKYVYNSLGRVEKTYRPWLDLPATPGLATDLNCYYVRNIYDASGSISETEEKVLGTTTRRTRIEENTEMGGEYDDVEYRDLINITTSVYHGSESSPRVQTTTSYLADRAEAMVRRGAVYRTVGADGVTSRQYTQEGSFDEGTGVFTVGSGGAATRSVSWTSTFFDSLGVSNKTTRTVSISDYRGALREETQIYNGSIFETVSVKTCVYEAGRNRLLTMTTDGDVVASYSYPSSYQTVATDAVGVVTTTTVGESGRTISIVKDGVAAGAYHEAQPAVTTTFEEVGFVSTDTTSGGALSVTRSTTGGLANRVVSRTDEQGRTTTYGYANSGRTITETRPGGVTRASSTYLDGRVKSIVGTGVIPEFHEYTVDTSANRMHTVYFGTGDNTSPRWRRTMTNGLDQISREESPGPNGQLTVQEYFYNAEGQLIRATHTGLADSLYDFDTQGRLIRHGTDINANGGLDLLSDDIITTIEVYFEKDLNNVWWEVSCNRKYLANDNDMDVSVTTSKVRMGIGAESETQFIGPDGNLIVTATTVDRASKTVTSTSNNGLSNVVAVQIVVNGLMVSQSSSTIAAPTLYGYDALGRQIQHVDPRTNQAAVTTYNTLGQVSSVTDGAGGITTYTYYGSTHANAGLMATQTNYEGEVTRYAYDNLGRPTHQWGSAVYPLAYTYGAYGEMTQLRTYRASGDWNNTALPASFATASPSVTTWDYHPGSGLLTSKTDAVSKAVTYTYYDSRLLATRTWARGVSTTYGYDSAGRSTDVNYSDSTPDVVHTYRRDGQRLTTTDAAGTHAYSYHPATGALAGETVTGGLMNGLALNWPVDAAKRPGGFSAQLGSTPLTSVSYGYSAQSRLETVSDATRSATYGYTANSDLLHTTTLKTGGMTKLTGARLYDNASRLSSIGWVNASSQVVSSHGYTYDGAGRRTRADLADGSYWEYAYNDKGEVTGEVKKNSTAVTYPGLAHGYTFDEIGNRLTSTVDAAGGGTRTTGYTANSLNEYSGITHPATFNVTGAAVESAVVKVNAQATERLGRYFRKELTESSQPSLADVAVEVTLPGVGQGGGDIVTTQSGHRYVAPAAEALSYDDDGNLVSDSRWTYTWDGENRLIAMETTAAAASLGVTKSKLAFAYDGGSRRILKEVYKWDAGTSTWDLLSGVQFAYDQWNTVAEVDVNGNLLRYHVWGLDLSQTFHNLGGVGALLWSTVLQGSNSATQFATYDGNGNISSLIDSGSAAETARFDYSSFGETVVDEKNISAVQNPFRFSTKFSDEESGLVYYGHRYLNPAQGRWLSKDPLGEASFLATFLEGKTKSEKQEAVEESLRPSYGFVGNNPINIFDVSGLTAFDLLVKMRTGRLRKMWGVDVTGSSVAGSGGAFSGQFAFFPDACELGFYTVGPAAMDGSLNHSPIEKTFKDMPWGLDISISVNGTVAYWMGDGIANAQSWTGVFYGINGGGGVLGEIGVGVFWDPNGNWFGGSSGIGLSGTPVSIRTNPQTYFLKNRWQIPTPICHCLIVSMQP